MPSPDQDNFFPLGFPTEAFLDKMDFLELFLVRGSHLFLLLSPLSGNSGAHPALFFSINYPALIVWRLTYSTILEPTFDKAQGLTRVIRCGSGPFSPGPMEASVFSCCVTDFPFLS